MGEDRGRRTEAPQGMTPGEKQYCEDIVGAHGTTQFSLLQAMKCTSQTDRKKCRAVLDALIELGCIAQVPQTYDSGGAVAYRCVADTVRRYGSKD